MKTFLAAAILFSGHVVAAQPPTDEESILAQLNETDVNYMWHRAPGGVRVVVFGETNPQDICDLSNGVTSKPVAVVTNITNEATVRCSSK